MNKPKRKIAILLAVVMTALSCMTIYADTMESPEGHTEEISISEDEVQMESLISEEEPVKSDDETELYIAGVKAELDNAAHSIPNGRGYALRVGGIPVTEENKDDILNDGKVRYDLKTRTLTIDNEWAKVLVADNFIEYSGDELLTVKLIGRNLISVVGNESCDGIVCYNDSKSATEQTTSIRIEGTPGSDLVIELISETATQSRGIYASYNVEIVGTEIDIESSQLTNASDISLVSAGRDIVINEGQVSSFRESAGTAKKSFKAIYAGNDITIGNDSYINVCVSATDDSIGIYAEHDIEISGYDTKVYIESNDGSYNSFGICAYNVNIQGAFINITYNNEAFDGAAVAVGRFLGSIFLPVSGTLTIGSEVQLMEIDNADSDVIFCAGSLDAEDISAYYDMIPVIIQPKQIYLRIAGEEAIISKEKQNIPNGSGYYQMYFANGGIQLNLYDAVITYDGYADIISFYEPIALAITLEGNNCFRGVEENGGYLPNLGINSGGDVIIDGKEGSSLEICSTFPAVFSSGNVILDTPGKIQFTSRSHEAVFAAKTFVIGNRCQNLTLSGKYQDIYGAFTCGRAEIGVDLYGAEGISGAVSILSPVEIAKRTEVIDEEEVVYYTPVLSGNRMAGIITTQGYDSRPSDYGGDIIIVHPIIIHPVIDGDRDTSGEKIAAQLPAGSIIGNWTYLANVDKWTFTSNEGKVYRSEWAYVYNPYAQSGQPSVSWFYFDANGIMLTGWQWIKGYDGITRCYYLNPVSDNTLGACFIGPGATPDGYAVDNNGAWMLNGAVQTR